MANKRIHYASHRAGIAPIGSTNFTTVRGLQSIGVTTTFNLEQVFEIGNLPLYENIEGIPDVEITTEKVMDGYAPVYLLATQVDDEGSAASAATLSGRSMGNSIMGIAVYDETTGKAEGTPGAEVHMSGLYVSSFSYSVNVDGNATESVTLVGNNKVWVVGGDTGNFTGHYVGGGTWDTPFTSTPNPKAITGSGGVNRREDVLFGSGDYSLIPSDIDGVTMINSISGCNILSGSTYGAHLQSWTVSVDLGREELFELGRRGTFYRFVNFPVEVTNEITVITSSGDLVSAHEDGIYDSGLGSCGNRYNLNNRAIRLMLCEGLQVDCGIENKLASVGQSGGDAGGGNVETTFSYSNWNSCAVTHPSDPVVALRP